VRWSLAFAWMVWSSVRVVGLLLLDDFVVGFLGLVLVERVWVWV